MAAHERDVAGLRCGQVLARLDDFVAGELPAADESRVRAHLAGCDWCERFGGRYAAAITALRRELSEAPRVGSAVHERLRDRLRAAGVPVE